MANKTAKNLLTNGEEYNQYYGDFRGVDFSSDHSQVHAQRLAYSVNMYKDYLSGEGKAIETIPGFRRRFQAPDGSVIYGIHKLTQKIDGEEITKVLIHAGKNLYLWENYPQSANVECHITASVPAATGSAYKITLPEDVYSVVKLTDAEETDLTLSQTYDRTGHILTVSGVTLTEGDPLLVTYYQGICEDAIYSSMNKQKSQSFVFNNRLYMLDGNSYLVYDGETVKDASSYGYIPTTYINNKPGTYGARGTEYEARNMLNPSFKETFRSSSDAKIGNGTILALSIDNVTSIDQVRGKQGSVWPGSVWRTLTEASSHEEEYQLEKPYESADEFDEYGNPIMIYTGVRVVWSGDYYPITDEDKSQGRIRFRNDDDYTEDFSEVEITATKPVTSITGITDNTESTENIIGHCTLFSLFDNRVFLSGNPDFPNHIFYCGRNSSGYVDPTYFPLLNYQQDGISQSPVTGMIPVADTLLVLKADTDQDGVAYFHTPTETGSNIQPRIYPSSRGLSGIGCLGACTNFLDDPVFVSRFGLEGVGQLSVRYERAIEHRSSLVDAKLLNTDLTNAQLAEWNGYLLLLVDGKLFLADSRQTFTHTEGTPQYEWYYLDEIGVYDGQYPEFLYSGEMPSALENTTVPYEKDGTKYEIPLQLANRIYQPGLEECNLTGEIVNAPDSTGASSTDVSFVLLYKTIDGITYPMKVYFTVNEIRNPSSGELIRREAYLCEPTGAQTGGVFRKASVIRSEDRNIFFGTENGIVCSFNFDKRESDGSIPSKWYSFDGRTIISGAATKLDNCGIPHLTKSTIRKSTVIKTRSMAESAAKVRVRTNNNPYKQVARQIARINATQFSFEDMDFGDFTFITTDQSLFAVREKEKKWVEKQYFVYSDEYCKPFSLYYISYRYRVAGRYR